MMRHKLIVNRPVVEADFKMFQQDYHYSLIYQMTRLCRDKNALSHDDRLDALTIGVSYFLDRMDVDEDNQLMEITEEQLEDWLNESVIPNYATNTNNNKCIKSIRELRDK